MANVFAHGNPTAPLIVSTLQRAIERAHHDAVRRQQPQPVLTLDLEHPEAPVRILGHVHPDGTFEANDPRPTTS